MAATRSGSPAGRVESEPETRTFDVFQGLIFAVDTKDRYTKQHSEDVARYGVFLAERLGLDARAGRHDPGRRACSTTSARSASPTGSCASPAALTAEEYAIVKQHVALGDLIVRDLPGRRGHPRRASGITTSAGTATATSTGWPARRSRSSPGSSRSATPSRR